MPNRNLCNTAEPLFLLQKREYIYYKFTVEEDNLYKASKGFACYIISIQFSSVSQSCPMLCDPMDCSMPGFPVHHQLAEFAQSHIHWVSDAIQPSHPLSSPSPPAFDLSLHQSLVQWVSFFASGGQSIAVSASASVLPMNIQDWFPLGWTGWISWQSKGLSRVFSSITIQKHQFFSTQLSL